MFRMYSNLTRQSAACLTMVLAMMMSVHVQARAVKSIHNPNDPGVKSGSALVLDEATSEVLYARESDIAVPIASISKLMTALVVLEAKQSPDDIITITEDDRD